MTLFLPRLVDEVELRAHRVRQVRGGEQDEQYPDRRTVRQACEARDEEHDAPDERSGVELRVRVHGRDVAQRDRLRGRSERDHTQQGVWALVHHAHVARGELVLSQNRTTDGLNRSPTTSASPVA